MNGPDFWSTGLGGENEKGTDLPPFLVYLIHASYVKQVFHIIHITLSVHAQTAL